VERRAIREDAAARARICDLPAIIPALTGKVELAYEGEQEGARTVCRDLVGKALLRENRDFHTVQMVEAAFRQFGRWRGRPEGAHVLVAAARYLAAHAPTSRSQTQTYEIAARLHRGERIHDPA